MKPTEGNRGAVERVLEWLGLSASLPATQWEQLERFAAWLGEEAVAAGGIGPREARRIWSRHLADSLSFAYGWSDTGPPTRLLDVGAGVGLPGIPLAILWPETLVTLLDRSGRRVDLAKRAVRRLGLENVGVRRGDALSEAGDWEAVLCRAVFPPAAACQVAEKLLNPVGTAVVGLRGDGKRQALAVAPFHRRSMRVVDVPATVLDGTVSLLIMGPSEY